MWGGDSLRTVVLCSMAAVVCGSADVKAGMARPAASTTPQAVIDIEAATNADRSDADAGAASGARSKDSKALKQDAEGRPHAKPRSPAASATPPGSLAPATVTFAAAGDAVANAEPAAAVTLPDEPSGLKVEGHIGARLSNQSEYEGAKGRKTFAAPDFNITFNDRFFFSITDNMGLDIGADAKPQVGVYMVSTEALKVGLALTYESAFDKKVENSIYGADAIVAPDLRVFATYTFGNSQVAARYSRVLGGSQSEKLSMGAFHLFELRPDLTLTVGGSVTWANQKAVDALFDPMTTVSDGFGGTITGRASELIELAGGVAKRPSAGIKSVDAIVDLEYWIDKTLSVELLGGIVYLTDNVRGTPVVETPWVSGVSAIVKHHF
ncbi:outer membrane scaffolding protein for murein synthesis (MipA/OmpV family) [Bradyrhizobium sp. USDA 4341]